MGNKTAIWYTLGEAEKATGIPRTRLDHACRVNRLLFRRSETGARLLSHDVIEKLRKQGLKAFPRPYDPPGGPLITEGGNGSGPSSVLENRRDRVQELVLESQEVRARRELGKLQAEDREAEEQHKAEAQAAALTQRNELEHLRLEAAREAEARKQRRREAQAQERRRRWESRWLEYALHLIDAARARGPQDAVRRLDLDIQQAVEKTLARLDPDELESVVKRFVHAAVGQAVAAAQRRKEIQKVVAEAPDRLPGGATGYPALGEPSVWSIRAQDAAAEAISQLGADAPLARIRAAAIQAADAVAREYEVSKAAEEHRQACERIVSGVYLLHGTLADDQAAREAVKVTLEKLPIGSSQAQLVKVRDVTLAPFKAAAETARAAAQAASDADRYLAHVQTYVDRLDALEHGPGHSEGYSERRRFGEQIAKEIRPALIERLLGQGTLDEHEAYQLIEEMVDVRLDGE